MANKSLNLKKRKFIWYPFLFAAYPMLGLLAYNIGNARPEAGIRPLIIAMLGAGILFGLFRLLTRDWHRAAFVTAVWVALFAAYGHVYLDLQKKAPQFARTDLLTGASLLVAASALFVATRSKVKMDAWTVPLNVAALALVILPILQIGKYQFESVTDAQEEPTIVAVSEPRPDIYYIVLDMYTRADTLKIAYDYDNTEFLRGLEQTGFRVAECSMANYTRTELSLASSLNMSYITSELDNRITPDSIARSPLWKLIRDNAVMQYVRTRGYQTIAFATGFPWSELDNADQYLEPDPLRGGLTEFESLWLDTTAFRILEDEGIWDVRPISFNRYRERTRFVLDTLPTLANNPEPTFTFVHLILPHPPFVFAADGSQTDAVGFLNEEDNYTASEFKEGYTAQVTFANRELTRVVREIMESSDTPPVIILQGDHGPWLQPRDRHMTIFNAYYLPGHQDVVTADMSPVNTFRLIFDLYLGGDFDLLPNQSYFSPVPKQYNFELIPNRCKPK